MHSNFSLTLLLYTYLLSSYFFF